jgi:hypothetical protein
VNTRPHPPLELLDEEGLPPVYEVPDLPVGADLRQDFGFVRGLDVGQRRDYSALAVVHRWITPSWVRLDSGVGVSPEDIALALQRHQDLAELGIRQSQVTSYTVEHLERLPLETPFPRVLERSLHLFRHHAIQGREGAVRGSRHRPPPVFVLDATAGIGGLKDAWEAAGGPTDHDRFFPVTIHGGEATNWSDGYHRVPKRDLASLLGRLMEAELRPGVRRLQFAAGLPLLDVLIGELQNFSAKININTGHTAFEAWREGQHDDLVLALALALWAGERLEREPPGEYEIVPIGTGVFG